MKRRISFLISIFTSVFLISSCASYMRDDDDFVGGVTVTPELLEEISKEIFGFSEYQETVVSDGKYFWVPKSQVYHNTKDCRYIKNSDSILSGTEADATAAGCERICSACNKKSNPKE